MLQTVLTAPGLCTEPGEKSSKNCMQNLSDISAEQVLVLAKHWQEELSTTGAQPKEEKLLRELDSVADPGAMVSIHSLKQENHLLLPSPSHETQLSHCATKANKSSKDWLGTKTQRTLDQEGSTEVKTVQMSSETLPSFICLDTRK